MFHQIRKLAGLDQWACGRMIGAVETHSRSIEAANALAWLVAAGADAIVDDAPRNWLAPPRAVAPPVFRPTVSSTQPTAPGVGPLLDGIADLAGLDAALAAFAHPLRQPVPPRLFTGNIASGLIILADHPDADDSPPARLLARMLAAIGLDTTGCAQAHLLPWSPPAGRPPRDAEIAAFQPFVAHALTLAAPRLILALGDKAAALAPRPAAGPARGIASLRGKWASIGGVPVIATFHPRQLVAQPELKRLAWADLQAFDARMQAS